jgi:heat shock protein HspQ
MQKACCGEEYADVRRRDLKFVVGDEVLFKVFPTKGIVWFDIKGSLAPDTLDLI